MSTHSFKLKENLNTNITTSLLSKLLEAGAELAEAEIQVEQASNAVEEQHRLVNRLTRAIAVLDECED